MRAADSDSAWEAFGQRDPYFAVATQPEYHADQLDEAGKAAFFAKGEAKVEAFLHTIRQHLMPEFAPQRALDFGCGVGRLTLPLAARCREVVGVDVSPSMLDEARRNCEARSIRNVMLVRGNDALSTVEGRFDLVLTYVVLQHIPPRRGERIIQALLDRVAPGGVAAIHLTHDAELSRGRRVFAGVCARVPMVHNLRNVVRGRRWDHPLMQMNLYHLPLVLAMVRRVSEGPIVLGPTDHGGYLGSIIYARKRG